MIGFHNWGAYFFPKYFQPLSGKIHHSLPLFNVQVSSAADIHDGYNKMKEAGNGYIAVVCL